MKNFTVRAEKYFGMGFFSLFVLILSIFTACKQPTWNDPVREYLEYYTETAAVEDFEVVQSYLIDKDGNVCIPSLGDETKEILLYMRNPKKFPITASGITESGVTIVQDTDDPTVLHLTYPYSYLYLHECGGDIGGVISLTENVTPRDMPDRYELKLKCNSAPDEIDHENVAVMRYNNAGSETFVLAFYRLTSSLCRPSINGRNRDIVSVTINGETYPVSISSSGVMSFPDSHFTTDDLTPNLSRINRRYTHDSQLSVYFLTGEPFVEGNKSYTIGFNDEAGLSSRYTVDTAVARLSAPTVKNNDDNNLYTTSSVNYLHTDSDGAEQSTVRIYVPTDDEIGNSVSNVTLHYELYKGGYSDTVSDTVSKIDEAAISGTNPVDVVLPDEDAYYLVTWVSNPDHTDSAKVKYKLNLQYAQLKAPDVKDLGGNLLSSTPANNYIKLDVNKDYATVKVSVPNKTTTNVAVGPGVTVHYTLCQGTEIADDADDHTITSQTSLHDTTFGQWCLKVKATKTGYRDSEEKTYLIKAFSSDIWVASTDNGGNNSTGDGTLAHPYATIQRAVTEIATYNKPTVDYTVHVIGTIKGSQTVSSALDGMAAKLTLTGESIDGILDGNKNASNKGTTLTVDTSVPVTIDHLTITGGYYPWNGSTGDGGGIYIKNGATVKLAGGAKVTGNEARCGGGVYVAGGGKLFMYGDVLIGDSSTSTNVATDSASGRANKAQFGGGIYCDNSGTVYMGYSAVGAPEPVSENYGIKRNYSTYWAGGVNLKGSMYLASGEISYNYVNDLDSDHHGQGGGIRLESNGMLNMSGGKIKCNQTPYRGGGIYFTSNSSDPSSALNISGGTMESNTAGSQGGAIFAAKTFSMSGGISIPSTGAKKNNDVHLQDANVKIKITENLTETTAFWLTGKNELYTVDRPVIQLGSNDPESWYAQKIKVIDNNTSDDDFNWFICHEKMARGFYLTKALALIANGGVNQTIKIADNLTAADIAAIKNAIDAAYASNDATRIILDLSGALLTSLPSSAFMDCMGLSKITLPEGLTSLGSQAFRDCTNLTEVHLPSTIPLSGTQEYLTFYGTTAKVTVSENSPYLSNGTDALYSKDGKKLVMYNNKSSTSGFTVPASVQEICNDAFGHSRMASISFASSTNLKKLGVYVFADAPNITSVILPNSIETIGSNCFRYNYALTSINIPTSLKTVPQGFCNYDVPITSITIPNGVTTIAKDAFWGIDDLTTVVIPTSVTTIGPHAFGGCTGLTTVKYRGTVTQKNAIDIDMSVYSDRSNETLFDANWIYNYSGS